MTATTVMSPNVKHGGRRSTRKNNNRNDRKSNRKNSRKNGGFAPAVMGSFVSNAHSAIVPLVLAGLYSVFGAAAPNKTAKAVSIHKSKGGASKRNNRKNSRKNE
jgi:hypothetical protein